VANPSRRIGVFGGTFDPPHYGHLWLAELAREQLQLDFVLFMPVGTPPHKSGQQITAAHHRRRMVELSIEGNSTFKLDSTDLERTPPHTTSSLLPLLTQSYPDAQWWLLVGSDSLRDLPTWHQPQRVVALTRFAVLRRAGYEVNLEELDEKVPGINRAVDLLVGPRLSISSTELRSRAGAGLSLRYLVPPPVLDYIRKQQLYR
jgi:nicotinate-nucleotide adenylyltransferase